nr:alpha-L-fucosidase [uncultured Pedobacter sp.]
MYNLKKITSLAVIIFTLLSSGETIIAQTKDQQTVKAEHSMIDLEEKEDTTHTLNPDAQWFPDAALGLFIHWGLSSVKKLSPSWPMIPGRPLATKKFSPEEIARVVKEEDYNLNGKKQAITPKEYFAMAKDFNPQDYDPDKWMKAAKAAGFKYAVLTTRHHEGFAMWPSNYGDFSTKNYMGGKDLVLPFVQACRKYGIKVGLYYSPPNWYFDRDYMSFLYHGAVKMNPDIPSLDVNLKPRVGQKTEKEIQEHEKAYAAMVKGQVEELLTRYGKIDLLWFDGKAPVPNANNVITQEEIRKLQPGIVINPRMHGKGDFITFERTPPKQDPGNVWAEFCNPWTGSWSDSETLPFRSNGFILGQLAYVHSLGVNYLLGVGPTAQGVFPDGIYKNMKVIQQWMDKNKVSIFNTHELPKGESASVPAVANGSKRYLFAIPQFKNKGTYDKDMLPAVDTTLILHTLNSPKSAKILASGETLKFKYINNELQIELPAKFRTKLVDVIVVEF